MPGFGGLSHFPRRHGGGEVRVQVALDTLLADRGTAFEQAAEDRESVVYIESMALARAISAGLGTNERLGTLWDAARMPDAVLERWEKILALAPLASDSEAERRARIRTTFERFGQASTHTTAHALLSEALGDAFVGIEYIDYDDALISVPDGSYPWGIVIDGRPWSSTVAHVLVRLQKPTGWTEGQFYDAASQVSLILDPLLPAWCTFAWYRAGASSAVVGGVSAAGFYLDTPSNLDNQIFAS
jgi:hypothetical protein